MTESESDQIRDDAYDLFFQLTELLLYQPSGATGRREIRLIPVGFKFAQFYTQMVDELVLDLGDQIADQPVRIALARKLAALVDDMLYSDDCRLDSLHALNQVLVSLRGIDA